MKKKMQEKEEIQQGEETNNKEFTANQENSQPENPEGNASAEATGGDSSKMGIEETADKVISEIRAIEEKLADSQDKYIRLSAEFDNYRKRTLKEKMDLSKYAEENILSKIVPFMDDFERALKHIETSDQNIEALKNGIDLIYMKFSEFLKQNGIREIAAIGVDFNVDLHEAVAKVQVDEPEKKGKVVDVALKGYYLHDKVLRFAKVVVGE
jgi:molecular chaperone GrpE